MQEPASRERTAVVERRTSVGALVVAILACLVLIAGLVPSPYVIERPGPVVDVLGVTIDADGAEQPVIAVADGGAADGVAIAASSEGSLYLLTVSVAGSPQHPKSWLSLVPGLLDPSQIIQPVESVFPEGTTEDERTEYNAVLMDGSQAQAAAAAFSALGEEVGVRLTVAAVEETGPASGVLAEGDLIVRFNGTDVTDFPQLRELITAAGADREVAVVVSREGSELELLLRPEIPDGGSAPMLGAVIATNYVLPYEVDFSLTDIGGPSAGLVFALGLMDVMTENSLLNGLTVSGTGTIAGSGDVGAIGGLEQKMWAASRVGTELFLMPAANCANLPDSIPGDMQVAPVATLDEAVSAIESAAAGERAVGVERCDVP